MVVSEANRDEALRCLEISRKFYGEEEIELAVKYAQKAVRLYESEEAQAWAQQLETFLSSKTQSKNSGTNQTKSYKDEIPQSNSGSDGTKGTEKPEGKTAYTKEQVNQVKRFLKVNKNDFYEILGVSKSADDVDIKKAYRKFHPDKNHAPGADEVFKMISRAFSCLSDPSKKEQYDRFGFPEDGAAYESRGSNIRFRGPTNFFESELSPEDIFNMFFGGNMGFPNGAHFQGGGGGGAFGPIFGQAFSSPFGAAAAAAGGGYPFFRRTRNRPQPPQTWITFFLQFLPIIALSILFFFTSWINSRGPVDDEAWYSVSRHVSLTPSPTYPYAFTTQNLAIPYYGTTNYYRYFSNVQSSRSLISEMRAFEDAVERRYVADLQAKCREEERSLQEKRAAAAANPSEMDKLKNQKSPSCEKLQLIGIKPVNSSSKS